MTGCDLTRANLTGARLSSARLTEAICWNTVFADCPTLPEALGLDSVVHDGPSSLDVRTLRCCIHRLPGPFLLGCGLELAEIDALRTLWAEEDQ